MASLSGLKDSSLPLSVDSLASHPIVVMACFMHETNTLSVRPTTLESFRSGGTLWLEGAACVGGTRGTNTETAGFVEVAEVEGWDLVPTVRRRTEGGLDLAP